MQRGIIIRGVGGNYYVESENGIYKCRARGKFRSRKLKPLIGDDVDIELTNNEDVEGSIINIHKRKNSFIRPTVANIDQLIIVTTLVKPTLSFLLLDKMIINSELNNLTPIICFNKCDLISEEDKNMLADVYAGTGYRIIFTSVKNGYGIEELEEAMKGKLSLFTGPSGVGKSSITNYLDKNFELKTGEISEKLNKGKTTTRHAEIYRLDFGARVIDTPGFSLLDLHETSPEGLLDAFVDIKKFSYGCRFSDCRHDKEPDCKVKEAVEQGKLNKIRYENYIRLYEEIKSKKKY